MSDDLQDLLRLSAERQARATPNAEAAAREGRALAEMGAPPIDGANLYTPGNAGMFDPNAGGGGSINLLDPVQGVPLGPRGEAAADNLIGLNNGQMSTGERIAALLNKGGESMTMGLVGDEASAALESLIPGVNYEQRRDHYRANEEQIERENPVASLAADVGGALVAPVGAFSTLGQGLGLGWRMGASAGTTGTMAAGYGFMEGEGGLGNRLDQARTDGQFGATVGAAIPVVGSAIQRGANALTRNRATREAMRNAPALDDALAAAERNYRTVDDLNVQIRPESFNRLVSGLDDIKGFDRLSGPGSLTPMSGRVREIGRQMSDDMAAAADQNPALPFNSLDDFRQHAGTAAGNMNNRRDSAVGSQIIGRIDDFVNNLSPDDVVGQMGSDELTTLKTAITKARQAYAQMARTRTVLDAIEAADDYVSGPASGIRNQFRRILSNKNLSRGFSDAEKNILRRAINGGFLERTVHLMGGGMGQLLATTGGTLGAGMAGGPAGALAGFAGSQAVNAVSRSASEALARKKADVAASLIASGQARNIPQTANPAVRQVIEQLMRQGTAAVPQ